MAQVPRFRRIRVGEYADFVKLYGLITSYVETPELASSVKEFVFAYQRPFAGLHWKITKDVEELEEAEAKRDISGESLIFQAVECLDLGDDKSEWVRILSWMKPELVAQRYAYKMKWCPWEAESFIRSRDTLFANHAVALLLMLCPNIQSLVYQDGCHIVEPILRRNNYGLLRGRHLQRLRHVTLLPSSGRGDERYFNTVNLLGQLQLFHRLPELESFSVDAAEENNDDRFPEDFPPATSNLQKMHVGHSLFSTELIGTLIRIPRALVEFTYTTGGRSLRDGGAYIHYAKTVGKALLEHKQTLRKIDLDFDQCISAVGPNVESYSRWRSRDEDGPIEEELGTQAELDRQHEEDQWWRKDKEISSGPQHTWELPNTREYGSTIGSLRDFESLTHLSVGIRLLLGPSYYVRVDGYPADQRVDVAPFRLVDALPKSLEYLLIRGYKRTEFSEYDDQIDELMARKGECLPNLQEIHGVRETIPSAEWIEDPDCHPDDLWRQPKTEDGWEEASSRDGP